MWSFWRGKTVIVKRLGPEKPRRRVADGIDAGFRIFLSFGLTLSWKVCIAFVWLEVHNEALLIAVIVCGLPFPVALCFGLLTLKSWLDERSWLRAERMARAAPSVRDKGRT